VSASASHCKLFSCILLAIASTTVCGATAFAATGTDTATSSAPSPDIQDVEVTGEHPGPRLWRVSSGDHVLWLLGTLDPLPRKMQWRSRETESVIAEAQEVLYEQPSVSVHGNPLTWIRAYFQWRRVRTIPGNGTLKDWIRPDLYTRFTALETRFDPRDSRTEKLRPMYAALRLYGRALDASHLTPGPQSEEAVLKLARKHHVRIRQPKLRIDDPRGLISQLGEISRAAHEACLESIVERLETGLETMKTSARAWAMGDVTTLRALSSPREIEVCTDAVAGSPRMKDLIGQAKNGWDKELESAIERNRTTLAMQSIYELLGPTGTLAGLRQKGYVVEGP
jgi:uncharacterized protein YbaP (TraB family)